MKKIITKKEWTWTDQSIWDCIKSALCGLKRQEWLTLDEFEHIIDYLQKKIDNKYLGEK
jgi:hypothetical protein